MTDGQAPFLSAGAPVFLGKGRGLVPAHGAILLGEVAQHLATVEISCNFCPVAAKPASDA
jgi:hypothetical protein